MALKFRSATPADIPHLAAVAIAGMPDDPQWAYRFPYRHEYPAEHRAAIQEVYRAAIEDEGEGVQVMVMTDEKDVPQALAVWDMLYLGKGGDMANFKANPNRKDASYARMSAFLAAFHAAHTKFFDSNFGNQQVRLRILAVHPDFRRRGAGETLARWGIDHARERQLPVTIVASPMGARLYARLGCVKVGEYETKVEGEDESVWEACMVWKGDGEGAR